ncbi:hypothetical protein C2G38_2100330 [Gigaspora rosea]|uniref:Uncharacterized protein n=1 Tax=Gigaspora rosea TaxID=44941 RepID=A0A397UR45_9GLOM|nr:hypothetical protein C2G38_2100330 [Gigaspora rosea]
MSSSLELVKLVGRKAVRVLVNLFSVLWFYIAYFCSGAFRRWFIYDWNVLSAIALDLSTLIIFHNIMANHGMLLFREVR